jgi:DHA1 family tetracycline resistance protein-like MFS transporter
MTVMIDAMGIGLIMPVMPDLIRELQGGGLADAALWGGVLATVFAVAQFLFSPLVGALSDRSGRRPVLLITQGALIFVYLLLAAAQSLWMLLLGRILAGIASATQSTANAAMADLSPPDRKTANFGLLGAAFGAGFVFGPMLGGLLAGWGTRAPFYGAAVLVALNFTLGAVVMRETVDMARRRAFDWRRAHAFGALRQMGRLPGLLPLVTVYFIYSVAIYVYPAVWAFFTQARFGWDAGMVGVSLGVFGFSMALVQGVLIRPVVRFAGERMTVVLGQLFDCIALSVLAFTGSGMLALMFTPVSALGALVSPALTGIMSKMVADDAQGELQGVLTAAHALAAMVSPLVMTSVFALGMNGGLGFSLPGLPFLLSLGLMAAGLAAFLAASRRGAGAAMA